MFYLIMGIAIGTPFGVLAGLFIGRSYYKKSLREPLRKEGLTESEAVQKYMIALAYDCPSCIAEVGEFCHRYNVWMCLERLEYAEEMEHPLYDAELSHDEFPKEPGIWEEVELSDCSSGCKVYQNKKTGRRVLMHNSAYGCRR